MSDKYLVFARLCLLVIIVRGLHGVVALGEVFEKAKVKKLFRQQLTRKSWLVVRKHVFEHLEAPKKAQHAEGRIASLSGNHPLNALCSAQARKAFETGASALSLLFARFDVRGYQITVRDLNDVVTSLRRKIVLAIQKGKMKKMGAGF